MPLTGHSYLADWVRISDDSSRGGWIHQSRIDRRP
jgi:SH3-like domain-containing protein